MTSIMWTFSSPFLFGNISSCRRNIVTCGKRLHSPDHKVTDVTTTTTTFRRSANYPPSIWSYDFVQSLTSKYVGEKYIEKLETLKEGARTLIYKDIKNMENPLNILNLIDDLQRLGISYHFLSEISDVLEKIYHNYYKSKEEWAKMDVNLKSLGFRLLRQHGYHIPQDIFEDIKDETRGFNGYIHEDTAGLLNLYEASYLSIDGENILDDARDFLKKYLTECLHNNILDQNISLLTSHALAFPLHWGVPRIESKWFIDVYERRSGSNPLLIELSKLDFNMVQAIHQEDLKYASRWWKETCWENFGFARDRLVENFIWSVGENYLPHFQGRKTLTKVIAMIITIDDIFDVYGTLHELEQFTDTVSRWDVNAIDELPDYMKICFLGFYNTINEISYNALINKGIFVLPYLKKAWQDLCKSFLIEARWYNYRHTPSLNEYINNAYISTGAGVIIMHAFLLTLGSEEALECIGRAENILRNASLIFRFTNDLATSSDEQERGDAPKSIECYMQESGATEVEARAYIEQLIVDTWKKLNKECMDIGSSFPIEFIECIINIARMSHFAYTNGNKHAYPGMMKSHVLSLLVNPMQGDPYA